MKGSLLFAAVGFVLVACSGATSEIDDGSIGSSEDDLTAAKACQGKSCGDACTLCPPGKKGCFETAVLKVCNAKGKCSANAPTCGGAIDGGPAPDGGGGAVDGGPAPWDPCAGQQCGAACTLCAPWDSGCVETAVLKFCHADGTCNATAPACVPPPPYAPCAGKTCGDTCTLCDPADPTCFETAVLKQCDAAGTCSASVPACK